jgi:hypothetical protein
MVPACKLCLTGFRTTYAHCLRLGVFGKDNKQFNPLAITDNEGLLVVETSSEERGISANQTEFYSLTNRTLFTAITIPEGIFDSTSRIVICIQETEAIDSVSSEIGQTSDVHSIQHDKAFLCLQLLHLILHIRISQQVETT